MGGRPREEIPALLAGLYLYLVLHFLRGAEGGFGSLDDVALLFWYILSLFISRD